MYKKYEKRNAWLLTVKRWHVIRQVTLLNMEVRTSAGSSVLKEEVHQWATSFTKLMNSSMGRQLFTRFLEGEFSDENMLFWNACEEYKREKSSIKRQLMAKEIYGMFLAPSAPLEINIDSKTRNELTKNMNDNPMADMFAGAQEHVYHLMERDCFRRFIQSKIYKDFVQHLEEGAP